MFIRLALSTALLFAFVDSCTAQEAASSRPVELDVLAATVGVWDAEIEVWPAGLEQQSVKFTGVETNRPYGEHWISSDFDSEFMGQTVRVHSIVGYDLDQGRLVGTVVDHGPYAATMTGDYDAESKTLTWMTNAKQPNGAPMVQKTLVTQEGPDERVLVLTVPAAEEGEFIKFMQIRFVRRAVQDDDSPDSD